MPQSMTAYARVTHQGDWGTLTWAIRSVNHRYLETAFRIPDTLRDEEMRLREMARRTLHRGKVDCNLQLALNRDGDGLAINLDRARQYIRAVDQLAALIADPAPLSPLELLDRPGVVEEREIDPEVLARATRDAFSEALGQLTEDRGREGARLGEFIQQRVEALRAETARVRERLPEILAGQRRKLLDRIAELELNLEPDRLEQETAILAQKADVDEELDRLDTHLDEIERVVASKGPIGRRLDFLMQELNREANTLSSKSLATDTTRSAVEIKVLIEQMREQIQNIE